MAVAIRAEPTPLVLWFGTVLVDLLSVRELRRVRGMPPLPR